MRGDSERGRAKGYAGLRRGDEGDRVDIVGMEAVRRDWTDLAHQLQAVLLDGYSTKCLVPRSKTRSSAGSTRCSRAQGWAARIPEEPAQARRILHAFGSAT